MKARFHVRIKNKTGNYEVKLKIRIRVYIVRYVVTIMRNRVSITRYEVAIMRQFYVDFISFNCECIFRNCDFVHTTATCSRNSPK